MQGDQGTLSKAVNAPKSMSDVDEVTVRGELRIGPTTQGPLALSGTEKGLPTSDLAGLGARLLTP